MHNGAADYIIAVESKAPIMPIHHHAAGALNQGRFQQIPPLLSLRSVI